MPSLSFPVQPYWITLLFELVFSQLMISFVLDHFLTNLVGVFYYRRINQGGRIAVKSADIPCFTTFLVGNWKDPINLITTFIRIVVVVIFLRLDADISTAYDTVTTTSTFLFDPTDIRKLAGDGDNGTAVAVGRRAQFTKRCRFLHEDKTLGFYPIAFDLVGGVTFDTEYMDPDKNRLTEIADSKLYCLSPEHTPATVRKYVSVIGCSPNSTSCQDTMPVAVNVAREALEPNGKSYAGNELYNYTFHALRAETVPKAIKQTWTGFSVETESFACLRMPIGNNDTSFLSCLVVANVATASGIKGTLIEFWSVIYNPPVAQYFTLVRHNPGPVLSPAIQIAPDLKDFILFKELWGVRSLNHIEQTALIVTHSLVYKAETNTFKSRQRGNIVTTIDLAAFVVACTVLVILSAALIAITVYVRKDERPRFHTIDGLSSILREEDEPSGRSLCMGRTAVLGRWKPMFAREAHLGPVRQPSRSDHDRKLNEDIQLPRYPEKIGSSEYEQRSAFVANGELVPPPK